MTREWLKREWWTPCRVWALLFLAAGLAVMGGIFYMGIIIPAFGAIIGGMFLGFSMAPRDADLGFGILGAAAGYVLYAVVHLPQQCQIVCGP
jgi:hypothetical protein